MLVLHQKWRHLTTTLVSFISYRETDKVFMGFGIYPLEIECIKYLQFLFEYLSFSYWVWQLGYGNIVPLSFSHQFIMVVFQQLFCNDDPVFIVGRKLLINVLLLVIMSYIQIMCFFDVAPLVKLVYIGYLYLRVDKKSNAHTKIN